MAFLDNSGDIILDAVLTDAGRKRLARETELLKLPNMPLVMMKLIMELTTLITLVVQRILI